MAKGEQDKAEQLILQDKNLLLHAGTVKDLSRREFNPIMAFQYALWAMDYHMWTMIQKHLPLEAQAQQCQELETNGTAYGKHFSLQGLMGALQTYVDNYSRWNYNQCNDYWCKVVGEEQKLLPAHVVNEYCRPDRPFEPCPSEWKTKLPRTLELEIWDSTQSKYAKVSWFKFPQKEKSDSLWEDKSNSPENTSDSLEDKSESPWKNKLGFNYAFYRYYNYGPTQGAPGWDDLCTADLKALQSLWKTRTQQLELLVRQLSAHPLVTESATRKVGPTTFHT